MARLREGCFWKENYWRPVKKQKQEKPLYVLKGLQPSLVVICACFLVSL